MSIRVDLDGECPPDFSSAYWQHLQNCRRGRYVTVGLQPMAEDIYQVYPRHVGKVAALKAIDRAIAVIGCDDAAAWLLARVQAFAKSEKGQSGQFCPHPATWMNQGRYDDDQVEWDRPSDSDGGKRVARIEAPAGKYKGIGDVLPRDEKPEPATSAGSSQGSGASPGGGEGGREPGEW